jgi:DNA-binding MarR family transcriptional regulator
MGTEDFKSIEAIKSRLLQALADLDTVSTQDRDMLGRTRRGAHSRDEFYDEMDVGGPASGLAAIARRLLKQSDGRSEYFEEDLFADPAWHILLDLFAAAAEGQYVSVKSLCLASRVPSTTALRWIRHLETRGLIERTPDEKDGRRAFVTINPEAFANMAAYLARISDLGNTVSSAPEGRRPLRRLHD